MRRVLALEGAVAGFSVAVVEGSFERASRTDGKRALEAGLALIDALLAECGWRVRDLDGIAVGTGPGGFSGLRIAIAYAKGLALATGAPLAGISSYDAVEACATDRPSIAVVSGRAGSACARLRLGDEAEPAVVCGAVERVVDELDALLHGHKDAPVACHGLVEGVARELGERGYIVRAHPLQEEPVALAIARIAARRPERFGAARGVRPDYGT